MNNIDRIVNEALKNAQHNAAMRAKTAKPILTLQVLSFKPLNHFTVESRPMASERKGKFNPVPDWFANAKLRRAAESLGPGNNCKYVEDGDTNYKVRLKA